MITFLDYLNEKRTITAIGHPMIEHNGKMVHKNNSEGKPIHGTDAGIKAFHDWFDDSKLTDKHDRPAVFYHGTSEDFSHFSKDKSNTNTKTGVPENTHFFSNSAEAASSYAKEKSDGSYNKSWGEGGNVKPVYIKAKKILKIDAKGDSWNNISYHPKGEHSAGDYDMNDLAAIAKSGKYHALVVKNVVDRQSRGRDDKPASSVAVFTHNQVKSTFNNGKWDGKSDNISEAKEDFSHITTGNHISLFYSRNLDSSKKYKTEQDVGRNIEPHGEYMNVDHKTPLKAMGSNWETGKITFKNPIVFDHKSTDSHGWKKDLSELCGGKTGKSLSDHIKNVGHDGIITKDKYGLCETVNLNGTKS